MAAGVKRKAPSTNATSSKTSSKASKPSKRAAIQPDSDDDQDFDDEEDLLDSALNGTGSAALPYDEEDDDDDGEEEEEVGNADDDDVDEQGSDHSDHVEMLSDEDMEGGFEDLENGDDDQDQQQQQHPDQATTQTEKRNRSALYAIPTTQEVQGLKETGELFKSNVFKLKIDEMLPQVRPQFSKAGALELVLRRLHTLFESLESISSAPVADAIKQFEKRAGAIKIPFADPAPKNDAQYKLSFDKPSAMHLVGSWPLKSATKRPQGIDVDVAVVMPSSLFQEKDHLNFRYFHKRAFYLAVLADAVRTASNSKSNPLGLDCSFALMDADPRRPVLVLKPCHNKSGTDFTKLKASIRIHLAHDPTLFNYGRLGPMRNNVRVSSSSSSFDSNQLAATPRYNAAVLADGLQLAHLVYLHTTAQACPAFADACLLLKTWAFQRGFGSGARLHRHANVETQRKQVAGMGSIRFILTMILAHLLHGEERTTARGAVVSDRGKLANGFSSYQLFRGVIDWIACHDFKTKPVFIKPMPSAGLVSRSDKIDRSDFSKAFDRVLVDPSGSVNLFSFVPTGSVDLLQFEAKRTFDMLNDSTSDHFDALFLQDRTAPVFTFDEVALVHLPLTAKKESDDGVTSALQKADFGNAYQASLINVSATASRALNERCKLVALSHSAAGGLMDAWPLDAVRPAPLIEAQIGMLLEPEHAWKMVEHGPSSEDKQEAEEFRSFWGKLSELRRFKDGRVLESVVWPVTTMASRSAIPRRILSYALERHDGITETQLSFLSDKFQGLLEIDHMLSRKVNLVSTQDKGFQLVQTAYDGLVKELRALDKMPLSLIAITASCASLRGTSAFIPAPVNLANLGTKTPDSASYLAVQEILLTFESSGRWPDDLKTIQAMKAALFERMCHDLMEKIQGGQCRVAFDTYTESTIQDQCSLEIILPTGFAFRARIHHEREKTLLERIIADPQESVRAKRQAKKVLEMWEKRFVIAPRHHALIASIGDKFPSFGGAVRLVKRWISSQMLGSSIVPEELIELVSAAAFLSPEEGAPSSPVAGYVRILRLLANWRWKEEPLFVPIQAATEATESVATFTFPVDKRTEAETHFQAARGADPSMSHRAWFVVTEGDLHGMDWGRDGPFAGAADGVKKLAKAATCLLEDGTRLSEQDVKLLFTPSLDHYDFVIHLDAKVLSQYMYNVWADAKVWDGPAASKAKYVNLINADDGNDPPSVLGSVARPGFDAASGLIQLLKSQYADSFRLFFDQLGGTTIGGLWNPSLQKQRGFKVALGFSSMPVSMMEQNKQVVLNKRAILVEIERLGKGIVTKVETR